MRRHRGEGTTDMRGGEATSRRLEGEVVAVTAVFCDAVQVVARGRIEGGRWVSKGGAGAARLGR